MLRPCSIQMALTYFFIHFPLFLENCIIAYKSLEPLNLCDLNVWPSSLNTPKCLVYSVVKHCIYFQRGLLLMASFMRCIVSNDWFVPWRKLQISKTSRPEPQAWISESVGPYRAASQHVVPRPERDCRRDPTVDHRAYRRGIVFAVS